MSRLYDVVVLGATGYTGALVVEYLNQSRSGQYCKWAVAGRSAARLKVLLDSRNIAAPIVVADCADAASLDALCLSTTVVIACAGPFMEVGMPVVDACVRNKTHYVDITGEFQFVRKVIEKHHDAAVAQGVYIVPCCGFDSVPGDLGNLVAHKTAAERHLSSQLQEVRAFYSVKGAVSGGTMASIGRLFKTITKADMSPISLNPADSRRNVPTVTRAGIRFEKDLEMYSAPFLMSGINERVVRRSNALFSRATSLYCEAVGGPFAYAFANTFGYYAVGILMAIPFTRAFLLKFCFPLQGTGPSDDARAKGKFKTVFRAVPGAPTEQPFFVEVGSKHDPYDITAVFVAESACSILDMVSNSRPSECGLNGGVLTPASAFGTILLERLGVAGVKYSVRSEPLADKKNV